MQQGPFYTMRMQYYKQQLDQFQGYNEFFKGLALQWNSKLIFPDDLKQFTQLMGAFFCTIIKLSKNQQICQQYKEIYDQTIQQLDQNSDLLTYLVQHIFDLSGQLQGIPVTPDFEKIGKKFLESFEFYKQQPDRLSKALVWEGQVVSQQNNNTNFRIIICQQQNGKASLLFSTNLDTNHFYQTFSQIQRNSVKGGQQGTGVQQQFAFQQNPGAQIQFTVQQQQAFVPQQTNGVQFKANNNFQFMGQNQNTFNKNNNQNQQNSNFPPQTNFQQQFFPQPPTNTFAPTQGNNQTIFQPSNFAPQTNTLTQSQPTTQASNFCQSSNFSQQSSSVQPQTSGFIQNQQSNFPQFQKFSSPPNQITQFAQSTNNTSQFPQNNKMMSPGQTMQEVTNAISDLNISNEEGIDVMSTYMANSIIKIDSKTGDSQRLQTAIRLKQKNTLKCQICDDDYGEDNAILSKCCNNKFHYECYKYDLECKAKNLQEIEKITCFGCEKSLKPYYQFLIAHLETETWLRLMTIEVIKAIPNKCWNCNQPIAINKQANQNQLIQCASCNAKNCRLCKQKYHGENLQNSQCPNVHREIIKSMKGMVITICPFCNLIQTKDEKCNHVTCSQCKMDLCAICSVDRRPIIAHGNHYHREGCADYAGWKDKSGKKVLDKYNPKCQLCQQNGNKKVCDYPKSLDEYRAEKQY